MLNFLLLEAQRISYTNPESLQTLFNKWTNLHKTSESLEFLQSCIYKKVTPHFAKVTSSEVKKLGLNIHMQQTIEKNKIVNERNLKSQKLAILKK